MDYLCTSANETKCIFHTFADESDLYVTKDVSMYNLLTNGHIEMEETFLVISKHQSSLLSKHTGRAALGNTGT